MRNLPFYPLMVLLLIGLGGYLGCDPNSIQVPLDGITETTASGNPQYSAAIPDRSPASVLIGSFNVERLGPSKLGDPWVMERLADVVRTFDVVAIQEITSKDQQTLPTLVQYVNRNGDRYSYCISPRIGRKDLGYYEQYAFIFDTNRIQGGADFSYVVQDQSDVLHREPFVGRFQTISQQPFAFTLINIHTDPDEISYELDVLADVYTSVRQYEYPEDDVILLGDLNAAPTKLQRLEQIPGFIPLIVGMPTNSRKNKTLDNILVDQQATREFTGKAGTIDLEQMFGISSADAERISDHLPVWAEFTISEQATSTAMAAGNAPAVLR